MSQPRIATSLSLRNFRHEACRPGLDVSAAPVAAVVGGVRLPAAVNHDGVAGPDLDTLGCGDLFELVAVHRRISCDVGLAPVSGNVQQHAASQDAVAPLIDCAVGAAREGDDLVGGLPVPHALFVPDVAERVDVSGGRAVVEDAVVVHGGSAVRWAVDDRHEVLGGPGIFDSGFHRERPAERDGATRTDQPGGLYPLLRSYEIDGAGRAFVAPSAPVAAVPEICSLVGASLAVTWQT